MRGSQKPTPITPMFDLFVGITSMVNLLVLYYGALRFNSSLGQLYAHNSFRYFVLYVTFTIGTSVLFGVNMVQFVSQWRRYGLRQPFHTSGGGIGALLGLIASSCPVCGSTALSLLGIVGGLSSLPFQGLEIKALSLGFMVGSVLYSSWRLRNQQCSDDTCPVVLDEAFKKPTFTAFAPLIALTLFVSVTGWTLFKTDSINSPTTLQASYMCAGAEVNH